MSVTSNHNLGTRVRTRTCLHRAPSSREFVFMMNAANQANRFTVTLNVARMAKCDEIWSWNMKKEFGGPCECVQCNPE